LHCSFSPKYLDGSRIDGFLFFALMFFGGIWLPRPMMPAVLLNISNWTPLDIR